MRVNNIISVGLLAVHSFAFIPGFSNWLSDSRSSHQKRALGDVEDGPSGDSEAERLARLVRCPSLVT